MCDVWADFGPPVYMTSARLAGWKPKRRPDNEIIEVGPALAEFLAHIPGSQ